MLELSGFRAHGREIDLRQSRALGMDTTTAARFQRIWRYPGNLFVGQLFDGTYQIELAMRPMDHRTRKSAECALFFYWYVSEVEELFTVHCMAGVLRDYADWRKLPYGLPHIMLSAARDKARSSSNRKHRDDLAFLEWFNSIWDNMGTPEERGEALANPGEPGRYPFAMSDDDET